mgnify:CR=1 FL=1
MKRPAPDKRPMYWFYCHAPLSAATRQRDHFPLPDRHGGLQTVDACTPCHDAKDRVSIERWPVEWIAELVAEMPTMSRAARLFLGRSFAMLADMIRERERYAEVRGLVRRLIGDAFDPSVGDQAPGHDHAVPGVWDADNEPGIAGTPCQTCASWRRLTELLREG